MENISLPDIRQSIQQIFKGQKPDLKKICTDCKNKGAFDSLGGGEGWDKLRQSVIEAGKNMNQAKV